MQIKKPIVSVVMAAYNEEKFIKEAIESILNQTYPFFEFIIVNDGSTDKTEQIVLSFFDPRIKYIKNDANLKLIASLNKGLSLATGKYVARMDADDISMPDRLEKQVRYMESNPEVGISGAQLMVFGSANTTMNYPFEHDDIKLRLLITSSFPNNLVIFRRELMQQFKMSFSAGYHHGEDYKFWTQWVQITKGANLPDYLVKYRFHASSVSHKFRDVQRLTRNRIRVEYLNELFDLNSNQSLASDLYGNDYIKKIKGLKFVILRNKELKLFDEKKLRDTLFYLWYLDSLEQVEYDKSVVYNFPRIFILSFTDNIKYYQNIFKHTIKSFLGLLPKSA